MWRRIHAGYYRSANFLIQRIDGMYGPRWELTLTTELGSTLTIRKSTLHEAQAAAAAIVLESPLLALAAVTEA